MVQPSNQGFEREDSRPGGKTMREVLWVQRQKRSNKEKFMEQVRQITKEKDKEENN